MGFICVYLFGAQGKFFCLFCHFYKPRSEFIICCEQFCAHTFIIEAGSQMKETNEKINSIFFAIKCNIFWGRKIFSGR